MRILIFFCTLILKAQTPDPLLTDDWEAQQEWVDSIYSKMSLDEKIGQLFMVMAFSEQGLDHYKTIEKQVEEFHLGGIIFSLGGPVTQSNWVNSLQKTSKIPLLIGMDAEWGVAMRLDSVRPFPWNMTLGAIQDNKLVDEIGYRIGEQANRLGVHINFSPDVDINTNPNNPIIGNRSFGEDKINVSEKGIAYMSGMHRAGVLSSAKHFPGHGDASKDSHLDLPLINFSRARLKETEIAPFKALIDSGVSSVMVAHLNIPALDEGVPSSLSKKIITGLLKNTLGFKGLVITDALNMKGVTEFSGFDSLDVAAFLAGNDVLLIPNNIQRAVNKMKRAYRQQEFDEVRLAHSVKKILKAKYKVGLSNYTPIELTDLITDLNTEKDNYLIETAFAESITLVTKRGELMLPKEKQYGYIKMGDDKGDIFFKTLSKNRKLTVLNSKGSEDDVIEQAKPYSEIIVGFHRSNQTPWKPSDFTQKERKILDELARTHSLTLAAFVKPYALSKITSLSDYRTVLMSYQNSDEAQRLTAEILLGKRGVKGKLPVSISNLFEVGHGISLTKQTALTYSDPYSVGIDSVKLLAIDELAKITIDSMMAPGMQILAARNGKIFYHKSFGYHTYKKEVSVKNDHLYDLASLTKVLTTLPLVAQEIESGSLSFDQRLGDLSPLFEDSNKADLNLKEVLSYQSGIVPWVPFYKETLRNRDGKLMRKHYRSKKSTRFNSEVAKTVFTRSSQKESQLEALLDTDLLEKGRHYSDLPLIFMQHYLEDKFNLPLNIMVEERFYKPLGLTSTLFNPLQRFPESQIVPSEVDNYFRNQTLQGYVHDMTAAIQGGVSGHAGLFSNSYEVAILMQMLLQKGQYGGRTYFSENTFDLFNQCYYCDDQNRHGIILDKPQLWGGGMTFQGISPDSFGISGFTGNLAWADPETQIVFVFLSNRTFPSMDNNKLSEHNIRTRMLKFVYDAILY